MSEASWISIAQFAKQHGLSYATAHRRVVDGSFASMRTPSGSILVRAAETKEPAPLNSATVVAKERKRLPFGLLLITPVLASAAAFGITAGTGAIDYNFVPQMVTATAQNIFPSDHGPLEEAARDGAVKAQLAVTEGGWQQLEKVHLQSTDSTYVRLQVEGGTDYTVTAVDRQGGDAYRYESATGRFVPTKGIYDANSRSYR